MGKSKGTLCFPNSIGLAQHLERAHSHRYCVAVKNITVSVDDALYRAARVVAARHQTSVSALVRGYLSALVAGKASLHSNDSEADDVQQRRKLARLFREANLVLGYQPSREKTYVR